MSRRTLAQLHVSQHLHTGTTSSPPPSSWPRTILTQCRPPSTRRLSTKNTSTVRRPEKVCLSNIEVENLEGYTIGGYHPTVIGDNFHSGRYEVVHKLGFGGYSTIWLARDRHLQRCVSLKILMADHTLESNEAKILRLLSSGSSEPPHPGQRFVPHLFDNFIVDGLNGSHLCLIKEVAACSMTVAKEWSTNNMFTVETARSIAVQLILGLACLAVSVVEVRLHTCITFQDPLQCHPVPSNIPLKLIPSPDLHLHNFFIYGLNIDHLSPEELYSRYAFNKAPMRRVDGSPPEPHAPPYAVYSMPVRTPANELLDPIVKISDYGTSFVTSVPGNPSSHEICTPTLYQPPEALFGACTTATLAADIWTFGVNLCEALGEAPLFETFTWDRDDILADIISTLCLPPQRWWDAWPNRGEFFETNGEWRKNGISRIYTPVWHPLSEQLWDMGRGENAESCEWDVEGGEVRALEELFRGVLAWEPEERWTAEELVRSEYMVKWALPAWERQKRSQREDDGAPACGRAAA